MWKEQFSLVKTNVTCSTEPLAAADDDVDDDGGTDDGGDGIEWKQALVTGKGADEVA